MRNVPLLTTSALRATSSAWFQTEMWARTNEQRFSVFSCSIHPARARNRENGARWRRQQGGRFQQPSPLCSPRVAQPCQDAADPQAFLFCRGVDASLEHRGQSERWNVPTTVREFQHSHFCRRHNVVETAPSL